MGFLSWMLCFPSEPNFSSDLQAVAFPKYVDFPLNLLIWARRWHSFQRFEAVVTGPEFRGGGVERDAIRAYYNALFPFLWCISAIRFFFSFFKKVCALIVVFLFPRPLFLPCSSDGAGHFWPNYFLISSEQLALKNPLLHNVAPPNSVSSVPGREEG